MLFGFNTQFFQQTYSKYIFIYSMWSLGLPLSKFVIIIILTFQILLDNTQNIVVVDISTSSGWEEQYYQLVHDLSKLLQEWWIKNNIIFNFSYYYGDLISLLVILIPSKINCHSCICQQYCDMKKSWHCRGQDKVCAVIFYISNTNFCCKEELNSVLTKVKEES